MKSRTEKLQLVANRVLLGVDIGKDKHWAILRNPDGTLKKPFAIYADGKGLARFWNELPGRLGKTPMVDLVVAMEPTGPYWKSIAHFLQQKGVLVVLVNPLHTKKARELDDNSPLKADKKDARVIADLAASGRFMRMNLQEGPFAELRQLSSDRSHVVDGIRRSKTYGSGLLHQLFPEWTKVFKNPWGMASRALMRKALTPEEILTLGVKKIKAIFFGILNDKDGQRRADRLLALARQSASVGVAQQSQVMALRMVLDRLALLEGQQEQLEAKMLEHLKEIPYADLLLTIPTMGQITLAILLGEIGDLRGYHHAKEVIKLAGLNLYQVTSGQTEMDESKIVRHITKRGRPRLRAALYFTSLRSSQKESPWRPFYERLKVEGKKPAKVALVAISRKLLTTMYAMVRDESIFYFSMVGAQG